MKRPIQPRRGRFTRLLRSDVLSRLASTVLGACAAGGAFAQAPDAQAPRAAATKSYLNKHMIQLPIMIEDRARPLVQEIHLYCKEQPSAPWSVREKVTSATTSFTFQAPRDGEYWFTMVTVDTRGNRYPADVSREEPSLMVVVDSRPPAVELRHLGESPDGTLVQCDVQDASLDAAKTKLQYQTADRVFRNLDTVQGRANVYCIPAQANITGQVRVHAVDMAGNITTKVCDLKDLAGGAPVASAPMPAGGPMLPETAPRVSQEPKTAPVPQTLVAQAPAAPMTTAPAAPKVSPPAPSRVIQAVKNNTPPRTEGTAPAALPPSVVGGPSLDTGTVPAEHAVKAPSAEPIKPSAPSELPNVVTVDMRVTQEPPLVGSKEPTTKTVRTPANPPSTVNVPLLSNAPSVPATIPARREGGPLQRELVNTNRLSLEYHIEQAGASGVGKVEIWCTRDRGQTWDKLCEDADRKSPAEIELPGEGLYGVTMVVSNGRGFGATPPAPGATPDWWIEVDTSKPVGEILGVRNRPEDGATVHVSWAARDKNLPAEPVELYYAASRQGPWQPIAKGLKAEGQHAWSFPTDAGPQAFIRMAVRDAAGNMSVSETTQPIVLDDMSRPRARINGILTPTPTSTTAAAPTQQ